MGRGGELPLVGYESRHRQSLPHQSRKEPSVFAAKALLGEILEHSDSMQVSRDRELGWDGSLGQKLFQAPFELLPMRYKPHQLPPASSSPLPAKAQQCRSSTEMVPPADTAMHVPAAKARKGGAGVCFSLQRKLPTPCSGQQWP